MPKLLTNDELAELADEESAIRRERIRMTAEQRRVTELGERVNGQPTPVRVYSIASPPAWLVGRV